MASKAITYTSLIENGSPASTVRAAINTLLRGMEGKVVRFQISESKRNRSNNQNAYYWGVVIPLVQEMFRDYGQPVNAEEVHEYLAREVGRLERIVATPANKPAIVTRSTTSLDTKEFEDYMTTIRVWASEFGKFIPQPNEQHQPERTTS